MGMLGNMIRVSQEELESFLKDSDSLETLIYSEDDSVEEISLFLDKSWDGINYILTGDVFGGLEEDPNELQRAFFSLQFIDEEQDLGYGLAYYLTSSQVKETNLELQKITLDIAKSKINGSKMDEIEIYPGACSQPDSQEFLLDSFLEFKEFYEKAAANNQAVISFLN